MSPEASPLVDQVVERIRALGLDLLTRAEEAGVPWAARAHLADDLDYCLAHPRERTLLAPREDEDGRVVTTVTLTDSDGLPVTVLGEWVASDDVAAAWRAQLASEVPDDPSSLFGPETGAQGQDGAGT